MILGMLITSFVAFFINSFWSGRLIGYNSLQQLKDIIPGFLLAVSINGTVYAIGLLLHFPPTGMLIGEIILGLALAFGICEVIQFSDYVFIKGLIVEKIQKKSSKIS